MIRMSGNKRNASHYGLDERNLALVEAESEELWSDSTYGGEGGIRTPDTLSGMAAFEAARFNRSRTSPRRISS
jgi:hypothetical protein